MNILHVISSLYQDESFSRKLGNAIVKRLTEVNHGCCLKVRDVALNTLPHYGIRQVRMRNFSGDLQQEGLADVSRNFEEIISELMWADVIVIGVPIYNFGIPSTLKSWIDHIIHPGVTFQYAANGPQGLVNNKKVYLAISSGGVFSSGELKSSDFTEPYLRTALGFLGMTDVTAIRVEGLAISGVKERAMDKALKAVFDQIR